MAKQLVFEFEGSLIPYHMHKVDRSKLYGYKSIQVLDEDQNECELATLSDDGKTLIGKGGIGLGYFTADGQWSDKSDLKPVNTEGEEIKPVPSSFAAPILLTKSTDLEDFLNHNIRLVYQLEPEGINEPLHKKLLDGAIFRFDYSYRGGLMPDSGFLVMNEKQQVFLLVGDATNIEYVGLQQAALPHVDEGDDEEGESNLMDFGMI